MSSLLAASIEKEFLSVSDSDALHFLGRQFGPELLRLQNATSTIEADGSATIGDLGPEELTPSSVIFGKDFVEVNRTLVSMLALKWILANDYNTLTRHQKGQPLTRHSFDRLRKYFLAHIVDSNDVVALLVATVVGDLGKDPALLQSVIEILGPIHPEPNHDEVACLAQSVHIIPAVEILSPRSRSDVVAGMRLAGKLNISQLVQAENVPGSILPVVELKHQPHALHLKVIEVLLDVAGAGGHLDSRGAIRLTETVFQKYHSAVRALVDLLEERLATVEECYNQILGDTSKSLVKEGFEALSAHNPSDRALLRVMLMARVENRDEAAELKVAFETVPPSEKQSLIDGLNAVGTYGSRAVIPYYGPALFAQVRKLQSRLPAFTSLLRFLAKVCKPPTENDVWIVERDLSFAMDIIRSDAFRNDPNKLLDIRLPWA